jgi:hypothetical protein
MREAGRAHRQPEPRLAAFARLTEKRLGCDDQVDDLVVLARPVTGVEESSHGRVDGRE